MNARHSLWHVEQTIQDHGVFIRHYGRNNKFRDSAQEYLISLTYGFR